MKVFTSQVKGLDLAEEVKKYITALEIHALSVGIPAPVPVIPIIEGCVKRVVHPVKEKLPDSFEPDYELVDDAEYT